MRDELMAVRPAQPQCAGQTSLLQCSEAPQIFVRGDSLNTTTLIALLCCVLAMLIQRYLLITNYRRFRNRAPMTNVVIPLIPHSVRDQFV